MSGDFTIGFRLETDAKGFRGTLRLSEGDVKRLGQQIRARFRANANRWRQCSCTWCITSDRHLA